MRLWVRTEFRRQREQGGFCIYLCSQGILSSRSLMAVWQRFVPFSTSDLPRSKNSYFFTNALIEFKGLVMFCSGINATSMVFIERDYYWMDQINMAYKCADLLQLVKQNSLRIQFKHSFSFFPLTTSLVCIIEISLPPRRQQGNSLGFGLCFKRVQLEAQPGCAVPAGCRTPPATLESRLTLLYCCCRAGWGPAIC